MNLQQAADISIQRSIHESFERYIGGLEMAAHGRKIKSNPKVSKRKRNMIRKAVKKVKNK